MVLDQDRTRQSLTILSQWQRVYDEAYEDSEEENDRPACAKIANANARKKNL